MTRPIEPVKRDLASPRLNRVTANGVCLAYFEWCPELRGRDPTLFFVHATGFHARVWDQLIAHFPNRHILALEQRGHGRSETVPMETWADFGADLSACCELLEIRRAIGIGHSMGANALIQAVAAEPARFSSLMLCDPLVFAPHMYDVPPPTPGAAHPASKRLNQFDSPSAMFERFKDRPPYSVFDRQCLKDYCEFGLIPGRSGMGYILACAPATEADVYSKARVDIGIIAMVRAVQCPVLVMRGRMADPGEKPDFTTSPTWPQLALAFKHGRDIYLPKLTHLMPMQDPQLIAQLIQAEMSHL